MSSATTTTAHPSQSASTYLLNPDSTDIEPDDEWKNRLRVRIEESLESMVKEAKENLESQLRQTPVSSTNRVRLSDEYAQSMNNIRKIAEEAFQAELNRERLERRWAAGATMDPRAMDALQVEQQNILNKIKQTGKQNDRSATRVGDSSNSNSDDPRSNSAIPMPHGLHTNTDPLPLPPQLREERERSLAAEKARRSSDAHRDDYTTGARRTVHPPMILERPPAMDAWASTSQLTEEPDDLLRPPNRSRTSLDRPPAHDTPQGRPIDRLSRSISDRYVTHSPPKPIPEIWKPSISPEQDIATSKTFQLARRDSSTSMRSIGSTVLRPPATEPIPEKPHDPRDSPLPDLDKLELERKRQQDSDRAWNDIDQARERERHPSNHHTERRPTPPSEQAVRYDEQRPVPPVLPTPNEDRYHQTERHGTPYMIDTRDHVLPSSARSPAPYSGEERDHHSVLYHSVPHSRPVVSKTSFSNDRDHPSSRSRAGTRQLSAQSSFIKDDRDRDRDRDRDMHHEERDRYGGGGHYGYPSSLSSTRPPDRYTSPPSSATRTTPREYAYGPSEMDDRIEGSGRNREYPRHSVDPQEGHSDYHRPSEMHHEYHRDNSRPVPGRQASYTRLRHESDRGQPTSEEGYGRPSYSTSPTIPISVPRHSPNTEEGISGSWRDWSSESRRPPDSRYEQHHMRSQHTVDSVTSRPWHGPTRSSSSYQPYHGFNGRDSNGIYDNKFDAEYEYEYLRREELEEARRREDEAVRFREEMLLKEVEARKREEEAKIIQAEARRKEEEAKLKETETRRKELEIRMKEEEAAKKEEETRRKEKEIRRKEEETRIKEEEARRKQEEAQRKEMEAIRKEEEIKRLEEEARRKEEEVKKLEEEARRKEEEIQRREEELRRREEELNRREADLLEDERQRKEQQRRQLEREREHHDRLRREQERLKQEEDKVKMQQQEEFRRREEDINRRRADERKRQDSVGADSPWATHTFPSPSPTSTSSASRATPQRPGTTNSPTGAGSSANTSSGWNSTGSAWTTKPTTSSSATSSGQSRPSPTSQPNTSSKPRTGSMGSGSFPPSSSPHSTTPMSGAEWARRQEEQAKKQQEAFRREQERLEAERLAKEVGRILTREELIQLFESHERLWSRLISLDEVQWNDFPWPVIKKPSSPDDLTPASISAYILSPHYPEKDKSRSQKDRIKEHIKRWHPDRFETKLLTKVIESEKEKVKDGAGAVVRSLNDLLTRSNAPSIFS